MTLIINSGRFYFWPIIIANIIAMTSAVGGEIGEALWLGVSISSLASYGFLLNDLWDREVDRINGAHHFEDAAPKVCLAAAACALVFFGMGLIVAFAVGEAAFLLACGIAIGLTLYTCVLRPILVVPTLMSAVLASSPLIVPVILNAPSTTWLHWVFISALVIIIAARETLMDVRDRAGDAAGGRRTLSTVYGAERAKRIAVSSLSSGSALLVLSVVSRMSSLSIPEVLVAVVIVAAVIVGTVLPGWRTLGAASLERGTIQQFVLTSRVAMCLVPLIPLILW